jgi:hypothetical protein
MIAMAGREMGCSIDGKRPDTHCGVNHVAMLGRTHGVSLPLRTMEDHKASFRYRPEPSDTWREHLLVGRAWQRAKAACDRLRRIYDRRLKARSQGRKGKPPADPEDRVDDLISSIRKSRS